MSEPRSHQERVGFNEVTFRRVNEGVEIGHSGSSDDDLLGFLCECGRMGCSRIVELTRPEYEAVRANPRRFFIVGGHEVAETEDVVGRHERYSVVEKHEDLAEQAERTATRRGS